MGLEEQELREWVRRVATGEASRRDFLRAMLGLGLSGPLIADMLATAGPAAAQGTPGRHRPSPRPGAGVGESCDCCTGRRPTILNAHFAIGAKDVAASRIVYEPLYSIDPDGRFRPDPGGGDP